MKFSGLQLCVVCADMESLGSDGERSLVTIVIGSLSQYTVRTVLCGDLDAVVVCTVVKYRTAGARD